MKEKNTNPITYNDIEKNLIEPENEEKKPYSALVIIKKYLFLIVTVIITLAIGIFASTEYISFRNYQTLFAVRDIVETQLLSDYFPKIKGTIGDSEVYIIGTQNPDEPSILVMGGTHPNEPAGQIAATLLLEQIEVIRGTVYIITEANRSAYTHSHPQEATPMYYSLTDTLWQGTRTFKYGSRATNAIDQWPISDVYVHKASGQKLSGTDTRNLNRSYPGDPNGNYTEQIAHAIVTLIKENNITLTLDLHEASPEYGTNNAYIYHEKVLETGINGLMAMSFSDVQKQDSRFAPIKPEVSPANLHGLTHRELGDYTDTLPFLAETSNTTQGRIRGSVTSDSIVTGDDKFYERATALGILEVNHSTSVSLHERAGRHVETFKVLIDSYNTFSVGSATPETEKYQKGEFIIDYFGMGFSTILNFKIDFYLRDPSNPNLQLWTSDFE